MKSASDYLAPVDAAFAALSHPARRQILMILQARGGEMTAGAVAERFACTWPTTTRHLRVLEKSGLLRVTRQGRERRYRLDRERLDDVVGGWLRWFAASPGPAAPPRKSRPPSKGRNRRAGKY